MKNLLSLFVFCLLMKTACATVMDVNKSNAQSPYIMAGGTFSTIGDLPATVDSTIHMGLPLMTGLRIYVSQDSTTYIAKGGVWNPIIYFKPSDTPTYIPSSYRMNLMASGMSTRITNDSTATMLRVKYTDTSAMLNNYASKANLKDTATTLRTLIGLKQDLLVSGTNIKTVNGTSLLGSGNVTTTSGTVTNVGLSSTDFSVSGSPITSSGSITANLNTSGISAGTYGKATFNNKGIATSGLNLSITNNPSRSIVTTAASANGWQISSTRESFVTYSATISTTVSLSGNQVGYVVLEICPTNSSTASDWVEISRVSSGQSGVLVIGLTLNQTGGGALFGIVPTGYYTRVRSVNTTGTPSYAMNGSQETIY